MLQALLPSGFKLSVHVESEERRVYGLLLEKAGSKLAIHEGEADGSRMSVLPGRDMPFFAM